MVAPGRLPPPTGELLPPSGGQKGGRRHPRAPKTREDDLEDPQSHHHGCGVGESDVDWWGDLVHQAWWPPRDSYVTHISMRLNT